MCPNSIYIGLTVVLTWATGTLLGGAWVVMSGVIGRVTILITHIRGLITPLRTTHEPPSTPL